MKKDDGKTTRDSNEKDDNGGIADTDMDKDGTPVCKGWMSA